MSLLTFDSCPLDLAERAHRVGAQRWPLDRQSRSHTTRVVTVENMRPAAPTRRRRYVREEKLRAALLSGRRDARDRHVGVAIEFPLSGTRPRNRAHGMAVVRAGAERRSRHEVRPNRQRRRARHRPECPSPRAASRRGRLLPQHRASTMGLELSPRVHAASGLGG